MRAQDWALADNDLWFIFDGGRASRTCLRCARIDCHCRGVHAACVLVVAPCAAGRCCLGNVRMLRASCGSPFPPLLVASPAPRPVQLPPPPRPHLEAKLRALEFSGRLVEAGVGGGGGWGGVYCWSFELCGNANADDEQQHQRATTTSTTAVTPTMTTMAQPTAAKNAHKIEPWATSKTQHRQRRAPWQRRTTPATTTMANDGNGDSNNNNNNNNNNGKSNMPTGVHSVFPH